MQKVKITYPKIVFIEKEVEVSEDIDLDDLGVYDQTNLIYKIVKDVDITLLRTHIDTGDCGIKQ